MLPAPAQLYACPHCGNKKAMFSMMSCNTFGGTLWSDGRSIYPMRPTISAIQKCESCGSYSLFSQWKECGCDKDNYNGTTGNLTYEESREAYLQLMESGCYDNKDILTICLEYIHAYNDHFRRDKDSPKENDDILLFMGATENAIKRLGKDSDSRITKGELHRERREFDEAREILLAVLNDKNKWVVEPMLYHCNQSDSTPFLLIENGRNIDWSKNPNYEAIVKAAVLRKRQKMDEDAAAFINTLHEKRREHVDTDCAGGVYEDSCRTLLKILDECPSHYEIGHGTQHIAEFAAYRNNNLKSIDFPSSIKSIGARAFWGCKNLEGYSYNGFGMRIISIGPEAFMNCKKLDGFSASFLTNVRFIGRGAFSGMDNLKEIELPKGLAEIPEFCFGCDDALPTVKIPSTVNYIGEGAFFFSGITEITIPDTVSRIGDFVFSTCKKLVNVKLSKSLKELPLRTFAMCESLLSIEIPSGVEKIGERCFEDTPSLKIVRFRGKVKSISSSAFKESGIETIEVPWYLKEYYKKMFHNLTVKTKWS